MVCHHQGSIAAWPSISPGVLNVSTGVPLQTSWTTNDLFYNYDTLKAQIKTEYLKVISYDLQSISRFSAFICTYMTM